MRIKGVDTIRLSLPVKEPLIESGGVFDCFDHIIVKIISTEDVIGIGEIEAYPSFERPGVETPEGVVAIINSHFKPAIIGESIFNINRIWAKMDLAVEGYLRVKGGIDSALYDLIGKTQKIPVYNLLGGKIREEYLVEGVGYGISKGDPAKMASAALKAVKNGYREIEIKVGDKDADQDIKRLIAVRNAVKKNATIKIDCNGYYDPKTAIYVIEQMEKYGVDWVEQPVAYWDLEGLAKVRNTVRTKIILDESVESIHDLQNCIRSKALDAVHIKPTIKGGLTGAKKLAVVAESAGVEVIPGTSAPTGVGIAISQAFMATTRKVSRGMHGSPLDILVEDIVTNPIAAGSVKIRILDGHGLGIALDEEIVEKYRVK